MIRRILVLLLLCSLLHGRTHDGVNDYVDMPKNGFNWDYPLTVMAWVSATAKTQADGRNTIFEGRDSSSPFKGMAFFFEDSTLTNGVRCINDDGDPTYNSDNTNSSNNAINYSGTWVHVACVITSAGGTTTLYADGVSVGTSTWNNPAADFTNSVNFQIGDTLYPGTSLDPHTGDIFDFRIYDRALSVAEVNKAMRCLDSPVNNLVVQVILWEPGANPTLDDRTGANNGTNQGTSASSNGPPTGFCGDN